MPSLRTLRSALAAVTVGLVAVTGSLLLAALPARAAPAPNPTPSAITGEAKPPKGQPSKITFGLKPMDAKGTPPRGSFRFRLDPGLSGTDTVSVYNYATSPLDLTLYPSDATTNRQGAFAIPPAGTRSRDVGSWIKLALPANKTFRVPARTRVDVAFGVVVPMAASPGDHLGGIVLSLLGNSTDAKGNRIKVDSRISAPVTVRVAGELKPQLVVESFKAHYDGVLPPLGRGQVLVTYTVRNTGNILLGGKQRLGVEGWFGQSSSPRLADLAPLAPDSSTDVSVVVPKAFPVLRYQAKVVLTPTSPAGDPFPAAATADQRLWAIPWTLLLTIALSAVAVWVRKRVAARRPVGRHVAGAAREPRTDGTQGALA